MIFISLPIHELAHGYIAHKLGDDTAYYQGRLTLNPFRHLDLFGTILMVLFGYGWAKPVPVNPVRFRCNMRLGMALTALAGPVSNLILAFLCAVLLKCSNLLGSSTQIEFFFFLDWPIIKDGATARPIAAVDPNLRKERLEISFFIIDLLLGVYIGNSDVCLEMQYYFSVFFKY